MLQQRDEERYQDRGKETEMGQGCAESESDEGRGMREGLGGIWKRDDGRYMR